jgi:hypothetical protein
MKTTIAPSNKYQEPQWGVESQKPHEGEVIWNNKLEQQQRKRKPTYILQTKITNLAKQSKKN